MADIADFKHSQTFTARWEGGYCNHPNDPGGATKYGVSLRWLKSLPIIDADINGDGAITIEDVKALTPEQAAELFRQKFWLPYHCDELPTKTATVYYDTVVNTGPAQAARIMQRGYNACRPDTPLKVDGIAGPLTRASMKAMQDNPSYLKACIDAREHFYKMLVAGNSKFKPFLKGWLNRTRDLRFFVGIGI